MALKEYNLAHRSSHKPSELYDPIFGKEVAHWYLCWLENGFKRSGLTNGLDELVLSSYWQGPTGTLRDGIAYGYVKAVRGI